MTDRTRRQLERALHDCLDRRADPLEDPAVVDALLAEPDELPEFARLYARLQALPPTALPPTALPPVGRVAHRRRRALGWVLVAAAIPALATAAVFASFPADAGASANAAAGRLLDVTVSENRSLTPGTVSWTVAERIAAENGDHRTHVIVSTTRSRSL